MQSGSIMKIPISRVAFGDRHRRDMGDLVALADSIQRQGLLQPIGVTPDNVLVFGERRLLACRDVLGWTEIDGRIVNVTSLVEGEHDENEMRKAFSASERVAIAKAVEAELKSRHGSNQHARRGEEVDHGPPPAGKTRDLAAKKSGFGSGKQYERAKSVVEKAAPEVVEAMDKGSVSIRAAGTIATAPKSEQASIILLDPKKRREVVKKIKADQDAEHYRTIANKIERESGSNAYTQFLKKNGRLPKPSEAHNIAKLTGLATPSSAGFYETGIDPAEREELRKKQDPVDILLAGFDDILAIDASPADVVRYAREFPEFYHEDSVSDRLLRVITWLNKFAKEWNEHGQKRAAG